MKKVLLFFLLLLQSTILPQNNFIKQITAGDFDARNPFISPQQFAFNSETLFFELHSNGHSNIYSINYNPITQTFEDTVSITHNLYLNTHPSFHKYQGIWDIL